MKNILAIFLTVASVTALAQQPAIVLNQTPIDLEIQYKVCNNDGSNCINRSENLKAHSRPFHVDIKQKQYMQIDHYTYYNSLEKKFITKSFNLCVAPCPGARLILHLNKWKSTVCGCLTPDGKGCYWRPGENLSCERNS